MKIGIDLDGVVYNFTSAWEQYVTREVERARNKGAICPMWAYELAARFPEALPAIGKDWNFYETYGIDWDCFVEICDDGVNEDFIFRLGEPIEDSVEGIKELKRLGHSIHIITHRFFGEFSHYSTEQWLKMHDIPYDTLTFAKDKSIVGVDLLLDDLPQNLDSMGDETVKVLYRQTWNDGGMKPTSYQAVSSWAQFVSLIKRRGWLVP